MDKKLSAYFAKNGKRGGEARAKRGKKALTLIAKRGWETRRKREGVLTASREVGSDV